MAEKTEPTTRATQDGYIRRNFISECRDSRIVVEAYFSPNIRRIYRRHFDGLSRAVYLLRFYSRTSRINGVENSLTKDIRESEITNIPHCRKRQSPGNAEPQLGFFTFNSLATYRAKLGLGVPGTCILL